MSNTRNIAILYATVLIGIIGCNAAGDATAPAAGAHVPQEAASTGEATPRALPPPPPEEEEELDFSGCIAGEGPTEQEYCQNDERDRCTTCSDINAKLDMADVTVAFPPDIAEEVVRQCLEDEGCFDSENGGFKPQGGSLDEAAWRQCFDALCMCDQMVVFEAIECEIQFGSGIPDDCKNGVTFFRTTNPKDPDGKKVNHSLEYLGGDQYRDPNFADAPPATIVCQDDGTVTKVDGATIIAPGDQRIGTFCIRPAP